MDNAEKDTEVISFSSLKWVESTEKNPDVVLSEQNTRVQFKGKQRQEIIGSKVFTDGAVYWEIEIVELNKYVRELDFGIADSHDPRNVRMTWKGRSLYLAEQVNERWSLLGKQYPCFFFTTEKAYFDESDDKIEFQVGDKIGILLDWNNRFVEFYYNKIPYIRAAINTEIQKCHGEDTPCPITTVPTGYRPVVVFEGRAKNGKFACRFVKDANYKSVKEAIAKQPKSVATENNNNNNNVENNENNQHEINQKLADMKWLKSAEHKSTVKFSRDGKQVNVAAVRNPCVVTADPVLSSGSTFWEIEITQIGEYKSLEFGIVDSHDPYLLKMLWKGQTHLLSESIDRNESGASVGRWAILGTQYSCHFFSVEEAHFEKQEDTIQFKEGDKIGFLLDWDNRTIELLYNRILYFKINIKKEATKSHGFFGGYDCPLKEVPTGFRPALCYQGCSSSDVLSCRFVTEEDNKRKAEQSDKKSTRNKKPRNQLQDD